MIKLRAESDHGPVIVLGISEANVRALKLGHPIVVDVGQLDPKLDGVTISIVYGPTEEKIMEDMVDVGLVTDRTERREGP